ncbi:type VI secretion system baseplate subunit TssK [Variovorax saccharolyticus]|uniref:type VI secretion system baseplate subunit TssK n=1 Tax=Variovorax saccharolyticus TaxID=3053516 RepID=UPI0025769146|nr:type VI secretion system baseplate subunit TssK [Variovorax sp. J31P216]MDM0029792.1 type VI secretion system baseplate subunit TssK [Variovorax sp. J31P216]
MQTDLWTARASSIGQALAPVSWFEGLQLLPQHFQLMDARLDSLLRRTQWAAHPHAWGVERLVIDHAALAAGTLRIVYLTGQMPDGLMFDWSASQDRTLECAVELGPQEGSRVYALCLPSDDFTDNGTRVSRFKDAPGQPVADANDQDEKAVIMRRTPNFSVREWHPAVSGPYVQLPLLDVVRSAQGYQRGRFHPPAPRIFGDSALSHEIADLTRVLRAKAEGLAIAPVPSPLVKEQLHGLSLVFAVLVAGLPRLEAQLGGGVASPYEIYLSLCDVAGQVAVLAGGVPPLQPPYRHEEPGGAISAVVAYISRIVSGIGVEARVWRFHPFTLHEGRWTCLPPERAARDDMLLAVTFNSNVSDSAIASWLDHTLICWDTEERRCREYRVRGLARRQHTALPEAGLASAPSRRYVQVQATEEAARQARCLVVVGSADERATAGVLSIDWLIRT